MQSDLKPLHGVLHRNCETIGDEVATSLAVGVPHCQTLFVRRGQGSVSNAVECIQPLNWCITFASRSPDNVG